ncbi:hypothetical protein O5269_27965, partial [Escherichia coli]|nr:hypothetical protein [Escherichia coli]
LGAACIGIIGVAVQELGERFKAQLNFRAAGKLLDAHKGQLPTRLWVAPPTRMDAAQLTEEGYYSVFGKSGARIEIPGCSLC